MHKFKVGDYVVNNVNETSKIMYKIAEINGFVIRLTYKGMDAMVRNAGWVDSSLYTKLRKVT